MKLFIDTRFKKKVAGIFEQYQFEVGILEDKPHKVAKTGARGLKGQDVLKRFAGGPARKMTGKASGTLASVSKANRERLGFNYIERPFTKRGGSDLLKFGAEFVKYALGRSKDKRVTNLLQAVVRNPILRGEYGAPNSELTQKIKGFDRPMIDTGQLFKGITARVTRVKKGFFRG